MAEMDFNAADPQSSRNPGARSHSHGGPQVEIDTTVIAPIDRVRWGPIIAGIFATMSALAVLSVLGAAIGLSAYDSGDRGSRYAMGAGVWGVISALVSFFFGGWIASRTAAVREEGNGLLQGAMVWMVVTPLILYVLVGGLGSLLHSEANSGGNGGAMVQNASDQARSASYSDNARSTSAQMQDHGASKPDEQTTHKAGKAAWGALISMVLGLCAASFGGYFGATDHHRHGMTASSEKRVV